MSFSSTLYNAIFRRNQVFIGAVFLSAFGLEIAMDTGANKLWDTINRGRQWKDIKQRYMQSGEDGDDDE